MIHVSVCKIVATDIVELVEVVVWFACDNARELTLGDNVHHAMHAILRLIQGCLPCLGNLDLLKREAQLLEGCSSKFILEVAFGLANCSVEGKQQNLIVRPSATPLSQ